MRISDWSSDVCSSDLFQELAATRGDVVAWERTGSGGLLRAGMEQFDVIILDRMLGDLDGLTILRRLRESGVGTPVLMLSALGRTSDRAAARKSVVEGKSVSVRVDLGGRRIITKKTTSKRK